MDYPDIYYTSDYQALFHNHPLGGESRQFTHGGIDYRFYKRDIPGTDYSDIVSPYGYSGQVVVGDKPDWSGFLDEFHAYCIDQKIIAEFARIHPFESVTLSDEEIDVRHVRPVNNLNYEHPVYYIDLRQTEAAIWYYFDKGCRSAIRQADANKFFVAQGVLADFPRLYRERMGQVRASPVYLFSDDWFGNLRAIPGVWSAMVISPDQELLSSAIFLCYGRYIHYYLSVTGNRVSNFLLWNMIQWSKRMGYEIFNLGGGLKLNDLLESFKRSFTHDFKPFYTYRMIHNQLAYDQLCALRGINPTMAGYFPAYRQ